jgi:hypothetical protein
LSSGSTIEWEKEFMEEVLDSYIGRMHPLFSGIGGRAGHEIASALIAYKFGLFENVLERCERADALLGDGKEDAIVRKALRIIREDAALLMERISVRSYSDTFTKDEHIYLALDIPDDQIEYMPGFQLDNALLLIYAVALISSPDDRDALDEQKKFALMLIEPYMKRLEK